MPIPAALLVAALDQDADDAWVWLWKITVDITASATSVVYLTNQAETITLGSDVYQPYPMTQGSIEQTNEGEVTTVTLTMSNVTRKLSTFIETGAGLANMPVTLSLAKRDDLASGAALVFDFTVGNVTLTRASATLTLESPNFFQRVSPRDTVSRDRCRWRFKGKECGYVGTLSTCDKSLPTCILRGDDERDSGLTRNHPQRFGGFPGIERGLSG